MRPETSFLALRDSGYDITGKYESIFNELSSISSIREADWWMHCEEVSNKLSEPEKHNLLLIAIKFFLDDNLIAKDEHDFILKFTQALHIDIEEFKKTQKKTIERILAIQLHLFYLDMEIDPQEAEEITYLQEIFGYSFAEIEEMRRGIG